MRLAILFEDLDDKDTFESSYDCPSCDHQERMGGLADEDFHKAHQAAETAIQNSEFRFTGANQKRHEIYATIMNKYGYGQEVDPSRSWPSWTKNQSKKT